MNDARIDSLAKDLWFLMDQEDDINWNVVPVVKKQRYREYAVMLVILEDERCRNAYMH